MPSVKYVVANHAQLMWAAAYAALAFSTILQQSSPQTLWPTESDSLKQQAYFAKRLAASSMAMFTTASAANHTPSAEVSMLT